MLQNQRGTCRRHGGPAVEREMLENAEHSQAMNACCLGQLGDIARVDSCIGEALISPI